MENETFIIEQDAIQDLREIAQTVTACIFLVLIIIIALVGNISVIMVVMLYRQMQKDISNMLIVNLSITDLTNTCLVMLSALVALIADEWVFGTLWCDIICAVNYCLIIVSMLTLCCISLDRYQAIIHPLTYQSRVTRVTLLIAIIYSWIQGAVFSLVPPVLGWVDYDYWEAICAIQWHLYRPGTIIYVVSAFTLCFLGPGIILCYCYVKIIKEVKNQADHITAATTSTSKPSKRKMSDKARIIWSLLVVVFAYFTCTTPFSVTKLVKVSVSDTSIIPGPINLSAALLGYMASAINPLIYGIFRKDFQRAYIQIIKMIFLGQRRTSTLGSIEFSTKVRDTQRPYPEEEKVSGTNSNGYAKSTNTSNGYTNGIFQHHDIVANSSEKDNHLQENFQTSSSNGTKSLDTTKDVTNFKMPNEKITNLTETIEHHLVVNPDKPDADINKTNIISITTYPTQNCSDENGAATLHCNILKEEKKSKSIHDVEDRLGDTNETLQMEHQTLTLAKTALQDIPNDTEILHDKVQVNKTRNGSIHTCTIASIDNKMDEISLGEIQTMTDLNSIDGLHRHNSSDRKMSNGLVKVVRVNTECIMYNNCDDLMNYHGNIENNLQINVDLKANDNLDPSSDINNKSDHLS